MFIVPHLLPQDFRFRKMWLLRRSECPSISKKVNCFLTLGDLPLYTRVMKALTLLMRATVADFIPAQGHGKDAQFSIAVALSVLVFICSSSI